MNDSDEQCQCCFCKAQRRKARMNKYKAMRDRGIPIATIRALIAAEAKDAQ